MRKIRVSLIEVLHRFTDECSKSLKKEPIRSRDYIQAGIASLHQEYHYLSSALKMIGEDLGHVSDDWMRANWQKDSLLTCIYSLDFMSYLSVTTKEAEESKYGLRQILFRCLEVDPSVLIYSYLDFCIKNLGYTTSYDNGHRLFDLALKTQSNARDLPIFSSPDLKGTDCLRLLIESFAAQALEDPKPSSFSKETQTLFKKILLHVNDYVLLAYPEQIDRLCSKAISCIEEAEKIKTLLVILISISEKNITIKKTNIVERIEKLNPFKVTACRFFIGLHESKSKYPSDLIPTIFVSMLEPMRGALLQFEEYAFYRSLQDISKTTLSSCSEKISGIFREHFDKLTCQFNLQEIESSSDVSLKHVLILRHIVSGTKNLVFEDIGPDIGLLMVTLITTLGKKLTVSLKDTFVLEIAPFCEQWLKLPDLGRSKLLQRLYGSVSPLIGQKETFRCFSRPLLDKLLQSQSQNLQILLDTFSGFINNLSLLVLFKTLFEDFKEMVEKPDILSICWPNILHYLEIFILFLYNRTCKELMDMQFVGILLDIFALLRMYFIQKKLSPKNDRENVDKDSSGMKIFISRFALIQNIIHQEDTLLDEFSKKGGYSILCQEGMFYCGNETDYANLIDQFLDLCCCEIVRRVDKFRKIAPPVSTLPSGRTTLIRTTLGTGDYSPGVEGQTILSRPTVSSAALTTEERSSKTIVSSPYLIYSIVVTLLDKTPRSYIDKFTDNVLALSSRTGDSFIRIEQANVFYALFECYTRLADRTLSKQYNQLLSLLKWSPTVKFLQTLFDSYFDNLSTNYDHKDISSVEDSVSFSTGSTLPFSYSFVMNNESRQPNNFFVVYPLNILENIPDKAGTTISKKLGSFTFCTWLCKGQEFQPTTRYTLMHLTHWQTECAAFRLELQLVRGYIVLRYENTKKYMVEEVLYNVEGASSVFCLLACPLQILMTIDLSRDDREPVICLYLNGTLVSTKSIKESLMIATRLPIHKADTKKFTNITVCGFGFKDLETCNMVTSPSEMLVRQCFILRGVMQADEVKYLHLASKPKEDLLFNWFGGTHTAHIGNLDKTMLNLLEVSHEDGLEYRFKFKGTELLERLEMLVDPQDMIFNTDPSEQIHSQIKDCFSFKSSSRFTGILNSSLKLNSNQQQCLLMSHSPAFLDREDIFTIRSIYSRPPLSHLILAANLLEKYLEVFEQCDDRCFASLLRTFISLLSIVTGSSRVSKVTRILVGITKSKNHLISEDSLPILLRLPSLIIPSSHKNKQVFALVDHECLYFLLDVIFEKRDPKLIADTFVILKEIYLPQEQICQ